MFKKRYLTNTSSTVFCLCKALNDIFQIRTTAEIFNQRDAKVSPKLSSLATYNLNDIKAWVVRIQNESEFSLRSFCTIIWMNTNLPWKRVRTIIHKNTTFLGKYKGTINFFFSPLFTAQACILVQTTNTLKKRAAET